MDYQKQCIMANYDCLQCIAVECIGHEIANLPAIEFKEWQAAQTEAEKVVWADIITSVK